MATQSTETSAPSAPNYLGPFITVTILFGAFGFLTNLNSNLSPKLEQIFKLNHAWSAVVTVSWFLAYLIFSVPSAKVIEKVGYKSTMVISLFVMMLGALLFYPAASLVSFPLFLIASFVLATGVTALQTSANPYVSILGPEHSAPARLTLAQAFNSLGAAIAPLIVVEFILTGASKTASETAIADTVQGPYLVIAAALLVLGIAIMFMHLPAVTSARKPDAVEDEGRNIWTYPHTVLGMVGIFFYVGIEIALAYIAIDYFRSQGIGLTDSFHVDSFGHVFGLPVLGTLAFLYYFFIGVGRFIGTVLMKWIKARHLLSILAFLGVALLFISMFSHGLVAVWTLVLCGFANSIMYPTIFALGIAELGPLTSKGSGVITMGNVGGAVIPFVLGSVADKIGIQYAFIVPILCYLYVAYYGLWGCIPRRKVAA